MLYYKPGFVFDDFAQMEANVLVLSTVKVGEAKLGYFGKGKCIKRNFLFMIFSIYSGLIGMKLHHKSEKICIHLHFLKSL